MVAILKACAALVIAHIHVLMPDLSSRVVANRGDRARNVCDDTYRIAQA